MMLFFVIIQRKLTALIASLMDKIYASYYRSFVSVIDVVIPSLISCSSGVSITEHTLNTLLLYYIPEID